MTTTPSSTDGSKKANRSDADESPSAELLEFLGEFTGEDGEWIDPLELDDAETPPEASEERSDD
jgi:hypothetical protein